MIIGGLSEQEVEKISKILDAEGVTFNVVTDSNMVDVNKESMQHNLRHLNSPSISTHILALELPEDIFDKISEQAKEQLLEFGITDQVPSELDFSEEPVEPIQKELIKGNKRLIGHNFLHQIILAIGAFGIYLLIKYLIQ